MPDTLKPKQTRTPKQYEAIEKGALNLEFEELYKLKVAIDLRLAAIHNERKELFDQANRLVNGKE